MPWFVHGRRGSENNACSDKKYTEDLPARISVDHGQRCETRNSHDRIYRLPTINQPIIRPITRPPLRKMMWTGIGILYAKAALFRSDTAEWSTT
jgi:hypothetical protein